MTQRFLTLQARPRVAPLGWPHDVNGFTGEVDFAWVYVQPDGTGWSRGVRSLESFTFDEKDLDRVLELFYENIAGPYPFDFKLSVVYQPKTRSIAKAKMRTAKRKTAKTGRSKKLTGARGRRGKSRSRGR